MAVVCIACACACDLRVRVCGPARLSDSTNTFDIILLVIRLKLDIFWCIIQPVTGAARACARYTFLPPWELHEERTHFHSQPHTRLPTYPHPHIIQRMLSALDLVGLV